MCTHDCLSLVSSGLLPPPNSPTSIYLFICYLITLDDPVHFIRLSTESWVRGHLEQRGAFTTGKNVCSFLQQPLTACWHSGCGGPSWARSITYHYQPMVPPWEPHEHRTPAVAGCWQAQSCTDLVLVISAAVRSRGWQSGCVLTNALLHSTPGSCISFFWPIFQDSLWTLDGAPIHGQAFSHLLFSLLWWVMSLCSYYCPLPKRSVSDQS